jgi:hypothetical protein
MLVLHLKLLDAKVQSGKTLKAKAKPRPMANGLEIPSTMKGNAER